MPARILPRVAVAAGLALGAIGAVSVPLAVPMWIGLGAAVGLGVASAVGDTTTVSGSLGRSGWRTGIAAGTRTTAGLLILVGLVAVVGPAAGTVVMILVGVIILRGRRRGAVAPAAGPDRPPEAVAPELVVAAATTANLCVSWQLTCFAMLDLPAGPRRCALVEVRGQLLDELERRDPDGFGRWLETGARANSDPSRYLTR